MSHCITLLPVLPHYLHIIHPHHQRHPFHHLAKYYVVTIEEIPEYRQWSLIDR